MEKEQLILLLSASGVNDLASRCVTRLGTEREVFYNSYRPIAKHELRSIYGVRARINQMRHGTIEGYNKVLAGMDTFSGDRLRLHSVIMKDEWFLVFTDADTTILIGILADKTERVYQYHREQVERTPSE